MADNRLHPYPRRNRGPYRTWLLDENPIPPRSTAGRRQARAVAQRNDERNEHEAGNAVDIANAAVINENINPQFGQVHENNGHLEQVAAYVGSDGSNSVNDENQADESNHSIQSIGDSNFNLSHTPQAGSAFTDETSYASSSPAHSVEDNEDQPRNNFDPPNQPDEDDNPPGRENLDDQWRPEYMPDLNQPIFPELVCTKFECLLMIMSFSIRHGLTQVATEDLCKLVNQIFGGMYLPSSDYMLKKIFGKSHYDYHFYCQNCLAYLTDFKNSDAVSGSQACHVCDTVCTFSNMNHGSFFITFPMKDQLRSVLENTNKVMEYLNHRWERPVDDNIISDVYDGKVYKELCKEGNILSSRYNLSITFNTDGASVFDSTKNTLWPIHFSINEFPPSVRFSQANVMLAGIWFGKCDPKMPLFLSAFVNEVQMLMERGFSWSSPLGEIINSKVVLLNCVTDSKARPLVQGVKMHNGYYGCGHCLHPGVMYDGSNQAKYPMKDDILLMEDYSFAYSVIAPNPVTKVRERFLVEDRTDDSIRNDMLEAEQNRNEVGDINGVKEKSILWALQHFDLSFGFAIDYMHAVLLGVVRHTTGLWFDSTSNGLPYYIGLARTKDNVNARLLNIKPPVSISRRPRSLDERVHWKANEWRSWLLYYSLPCLQGILPKRYLAHHCLLVTAIHILLRDNISRDSLDQACVYLAHYCIEFKELYAGPLMYFNVHLLLHLGKCVDLYGPLNCFSAFSYEGANGCLIELVKGSRGVLSQIANKFNKCKLLSYTVDLYRVSPECKEYCSGLLCYRSSKFSHRLGEFRTLGTQISVPLSEEEREVMEASGHNVTSVTFERAIKEGVMYHAKCYKRKGCHVQLDDGKCYVLERIIDHVHFRGGGNQKYLALVREVRVNFNQNVIKHPQGAKASHIKPCNAVVYGDLKMVSLDDIQRLVFILDCIDNTYVAVLPNHYEKD